MASGKCLSGFGLLAILQMVNAEGKTCVVKVKKGKIKGELLFVDGELWDAKWDKKKGLPAIMDMMIENVSVIKIENVKRKSFQRVINENFQFILLESARIKDERERKRRTN